jgi:hypothetical protein
MKLVTIIFLTIFIVSNIKAQVSPNIYLQEIKTEIPLPPEAGKNVIKLFSDSQSVIAITPNGVFRYHNGNWSGRPNGSNWQTAALDPQGKVWLASASTVQNENTGVKLSLPESAKNDTILCLFWEDETTLLAGTNSGLYTITENPGLIEFTRGRRIYSIVKDTKNDLWVATSDGLLYRRNRKWINLDENLMAYGNERRYFSLATTNNGNDILYGGLYAVGCIAGDGNHWIFRGTDGLPFGPATIIKTAGENLWYGTSKGVIKKDSVWHYYNGKRWLPDNQINDILPIGNHTVWIATPQGISQIQQTEMTLEQKASIFEERIRSRHIRHGLVSRSKLSIPGDLSTSTIVNTNNDGLWTSIYLVAQCFRYSVTKDPQAKINAEQAFEAMERLEKATGIPGFPARSVALPDEAVGNGEWHLSADGKWKWLGDTSSDEMVGHFFAYPVFYKLVAEGDMKVRTEKLVTRILTHITDNNFNLKDADGKPTRWGVWNPDSLNNSPNWRYERGVNSLQIIAFLKAGSQITGERKFSDAANKLIDIHGYAENLIQQKNYGPFDVNFVDNQLSFLPYYILGSYVTDKNFRPHFEKSIERTWSVVKKDRISMWNIIASATLDKDCGLKEAMDELKSIPVDMVIWDVENSHRWDMPHDPLVDRMGKIQGIRPVPASERSITKWNLNPYLLDSGSQGLEENDGAYFLLAYWMGRYHGFWN